LVYGSGLSWTLLWFNNTLKFKTNYQLQMIGGPTDLQDRTLRLWSTNWYNTIDSDCNYHGDFKDTWCECWKGYAGVECSYCANEYTRDADTKWCVKKNGKCLETSCGCDPKIQTRCVPLGSCNPDTGVCTCQPKFSGDHCEVCAVGHSNWNQGCPANSLCPSDCKNGGTCNPQTKTCVCKNSWTGESCDTCPPLILGANCTSNERVSSSSDGSAMNVLQIIAIIFAALVICLTLGFFAFRRFGNRFFKGKNNDQYSHLELGLDDIDED